MGWINAIISRARGRVGYSGSTRHLRYWSRPRSRVLRLQGYDLDLFKHMAGPNIIPKNAWIPTKTMYAHYCQFEESCHDSYTVCLSQSYTKVRGDLEEILAKNNWNSR